ncbi:hypothetical protein [Bacillus sp. FSL R12-0069]|uniref:hypothetical protein n=1 Tax=Bacillus sp. FSL R12-0069 TaxID=2975342 RepID=UPI0030FB205E
MSHLNSSHDSNSQEDSAQETQLANSLKIALISGIINVLGDTLATYSAKLAIDEALKDQISQHKENKKQEDQIKSLQEQISNLQNQINKLTEKHT